VLLIRSIEKDGVVAAHLGCARCWWIKTPDVWVPRLSEVFEHTAPRRQQPFFDGWYRVSDVISMIIKAVTEYKADDVPALCKLVARVESAPAQLKVSMDKLESDLVELEEHVEELKWFNDTVRVADLSDAHCVEGQRFRDWIGIFPEIQLVQEHTRGVWVEDYVVSFLSGAEMALWGVWSDQVSRW